MAIQKRLLSKLKSTHAALEMISKGDLREVHALLQEMKEAQALCQKGLPKDAYEKYGEIYDGLILVFHQLLSGETGNDTREILALCEELLRHLAAETEKEKKFKKDIVFLPYKASMWDSLESVWKAAEEDKEHCNAYVVPIPYADLTPDRGVA
ncbi:MAG: hypothetical protein IJT01_11160, partial [Selenomonadaceae bacterium]|nr:hypothetical protein [Selenomonadaceae bacterium]